MNTFEKLCESCPLFQNWEPKEGDRYYTKTPLYFIEEGDGKYSITVTKPENKKVTLFKEGIHYLPFNETAELIRKHSFFLPYIHQLQNKLLQTSFPNSFHLLSNFFKFAFNPEMGVPAKYYDHESLWVLFYAYENWYNWNIDTESWEEID